MKKAILILFLAIFITSVASPVLAGGDKNRGDKGKGKVVQVQVNK